MPPTRALARATLLASLVLALSIRPALAQDAEPEAPAGEEPARKARPKPKPKPPAPKPAAKAAPAPAPPATPAPATPAAGVWPVGASSVSESYGDWTMSCIRPSDKVQCAVVQSQGDSKTGRRKFGIELQAPRDGRSEGTVLMPFGLAIEPGVTFKLDEQSLGKGAPYLSCSSEGCLVPISFPTLAIDGMRAARTLTVTGQKAGASEPAVISVPLEGFPQAFARAVALSG